MQRPEVSERESTLFRQHQQQIYATVDRWFAVLMIVQWISAVLLALLYSPQTWSGAEARTNPHVYLAVFLGGVVSGLPILLALLQPGRRSTRYVVACAQMLWSALLIHLSGGRIETHFHVFGSLAFLAFYRDYTVLVPATLVVAGDHLLRQLFWPESVYGILNPEWWRFLEHAGWVVFENVVLVFSCIRGQEEMLAIARRQAEVELLSESERQKSDQLAASQDALVRSEKLAAVGELAASVGHELRNPLTAIRNASMVLVKRMNTLNVEDEKTRRVLTLIDGELAACNRIVSDLLDFARERPLQLEATSLCELADEAIGLLPPHRVRVENQIPASMPQVLLDRGQFRQVLINLMQNAVEASSEHEGGRVTVEVREGPGGTTRLVVEDTGSGMTAEVRTKLFEPLFTTKAKGTGLGMAIVANIVRQHKAQISVDSEPGRGTRISIEIPAQVDGRAA